MTYLREEVTFVLGESVVNAPHQFGLIEGVDVLAQEIA